MPVTNSTTNFGAVGWECFLGHGLTSVLVHLGEHSL